MAEMQSLKAIIEEVAAKHGLTYIEVISDSRTIPIAMARHEAMYRCMTETLHSSTSIGRAIRKDRSSVIYGVVSYAKRKHLPIPRGLTTTSVQSRIDQHGKNNPPKDSQDRPR